MIKFKDKTIENYTEKPIHPPSFIQAYVNIQPQPLQNAENYVFFANG